MLRWPPQLEVKQWKPICLSLLPEAIELSNRERDSTTGFRGLD